MDLNSTIRQRTRLSGHNASIYALQQGLQSPSFLTAAGDGWMVEWGLENPENGRLIAQVDSKIFALLALPEHHKLIAGNMEGGVHWIDLKAPEATRNVAHHRNGVFEILRFGDNVLTFGGDGLMGIWELRSGSRLWSVELSKQALRCAALSPDLSELAVGASDHAVYVLDTWDWSLKYHIPRAHTNSVFSLTYSSDGQFLLSGGRDAMLRAWDAKVPGTCLSEQPAHWYTINAIAVHPCGRYFATASRDKTVKIWAMDDFKLLKVLETVRDRGHLNSVNTLLWTPDGHTLLSAGDDRSIILWDTSGLDAVQF